jgi:aspartyl protease family protein
MSEELPRTFKIVTLWLLLGALVFVGIEWYLREQQQMRFRAEGDRDRRGADGATTGPAASTVRVDFLIDTGATGGGQFRLSHASCACNRSTRCNRHRRRLVTGQVMRADVTLWRRAPACGWSRCRRSPTVRCSAWTCWAVCTGSSATA